MSSEYASPSRVAEIIVIENRYGKGSSARGRACDEVVNHQPPIRFQCPGQATHQLQATLLGKVVEDVADDDQIVRSTELHGERITFHEADAFAQPQPVVLGALYHVGPIEQRGMRRCVFSRELSE